MSDRQEQYDRLNEKLASIKLKIATIEPLFDAEVSTFFELTTAFSELKLSLTNEITTHFATIADLDSVGNILETLIIDVQVGISTTYLTKVARTKLANIDISFPTIAAPGMTLLEIEPGANPTSIHVSSVGPCQVLPVAQLGISKPLKAKSDLLEPRELHVKAWLSFAATAEEGDVSLKPSGIAKLCDGDSLFEQLSPIFYRFQVGPQPLSLPNSSGRDSLSSRHLEPAISHSMRDAAPDNIPLDISKEFEELRTSKLRLKTTVCRSRLGEVTTVSAITVKPWWFPRWPPWQRRTPFTRITGIPDDWDLVLRLRTSILQSRLRTLATQHIDMDFNIESTVVNTAAQAFDITASFSDRRKEKFLRGNVTMRVHTFIKVLVRVKLVANTNSLQLKMSEQEVIEQDFDVSFSPDIVDHLTKPMQLLVEAGAQVVLAFRDRLSYSKTVYRDNRATAMGVSLDSDSVSVMAKHT